MKKQPTGLSKEDFVEVCKREGSDPEEKGVDRLLGLGSSRCGAGVLLRGGVSENARVQLLGTQPCQLPRWKVVTRNGGLGRAGGGCLTLGVVSPLSPQWLRRPSGIV